MKEQCEDCIAARAKVPWVELQLTESEVLAMPVNHFRSFDDSEHARNKFCPECGHEIDWASLMPNEHADNQPS